MYSVIFSRGRSIQTWVRVGLATSLLLLLAGMASPRGASAQVEVVDTTAGPVPVPGAPAPAAVPPAPALPLFFTIGLGYGQRFDPCSQCLSAENVDSFTGHLSIGKYLQPGLGIGVDASVWRRGHPGAPGALDSLGVAAPTKLVNQLGNASLTVSYEVWQVFVRGGVGLALGQQDLQDTEGVVTMAKGMGVGYTVGGGVTLPLASMVSLAFFANWNVGSYDMSSPTEVLERGVKHEFVEIGFGLTLR